MLQAQLMMGIRPSTAPPQTNQTRFQSSSQRPGMMMPAQQRPTRPPLIQPGQQSTFDAKKSQSAQSSSSTAANASGSSNFASGASGSASARSAAFSAQQAKQRAELLAHAQSFLNPSKKPAPKKVGETGEGLAKDISTPEASEEVSSANAEETKSETS